MATKQVAELTIDQYRGLIGQEVTADNYFNPTVMLSGRFFVSKEEIDAYQGQQFAYIKDLPIIDIDETIPDTTPPTLTGYGIVIPSKFMDPDLELFPDNQFELNGFIIPLTAYGNDWAVDLAYLDWTPFKQEQDYLYNKAVNRTFAKLWWTLLGLYQANQIVQL